MNIKKLAKGYWQKIATKIHGGVSKNTKNELTTNVSNQQENESQQFESPPVGQTQEQLNLISRPPNFQESQEQQLSYDQDYLNLGNPMELTVCSKAKLPISNFPSEHTDQVKHKFNKEFAELFAKPEYQSFLQKQQQESPLDSSSMALMAKQLADQKARLEKIKIEINNKKIVEKVQPEPIIQTQEQLNLVPCSKNSQKFQIQEEGQSSYYQDCVDLGSPMKKTHFTNPVKITFTKSIFRGQGQESIVLENDETTLEKKQKLGQTQEELNLFGSTILGTTYLNEDVLSLGSDDSDDFIMIW